MAAQRQADYHSARAFYAESTRTLWALGARWLVCNSVASYASLAGAEGQWERAVRLAGASAMISDTISALPIPLTQGMLEEAIQGARQALSEPAFANAWAAGRALSLEQALTEALTTPDPVALEPLASAAGGLSVRGSRTSPHASSKSSGWSPAARGTVRSARRWS